MKKVSLLLCLFLVGSLAIFAQESEVSEKAGRKTTFVQNGFGDNWFLGAGAGASMYVGGYDDGNADFLDRITVNPVLFIGKWWNPYLGTRLAFQGGKIHTFSGSNAQAMYSQLHLNAHVDFMFNVTNYFMKYNSKRVYNFIPLLGMGYDRRSSDDRFFRGRGFNGLTLNAGLLNTFRLSDKLSAFVEVSTIAVESRFDKSPIGPEQRHWNFIPTAAAGLTLNIGKSTFSEAVLLDQGLIDDLNGQINSLKAENSVLRRRPERCVECPKVVAPAPAVTQNVVIPNVVFFRLNSANIDRNQEISIYNTAQFLNSNPNAKVRIIGYADRDTGTPSYNMKLSEKRARNVAKALIEKYNINTDRVAVEWKGSDEQPYKENAWNRVAIFFAE